MSLRKGSYDLGMGCLDPSILLFFGCLVVVGVAMLIVEINLFDLGFVYVFFFLSTMVNHH